VGTLQPSLFDTADTAWLRPFDSAVVRQDLGEGAWVEVVRGWVGRSDLLFGRLIDSVPWRAERRRMYDRMVDVPRLVAFFGADEPFPDPLLVEARGRLADRYGGERCGPVRTVGLCLYRDGSDSVAWHGDTIGRGSSDETLVAVVSLGERRRFLLRPVAGGPGIRFDLGSGDLLVMGGSCQRTWQHSVPKSRQSRDPRISVQFRTPGLR
jgi:alkylated DNA repair dioxygenase AlkB